MPARAGASMNLLRTIDGQAKSFFFRVIWEPHFIELTQGDSIARSL